MLTATAWPKADKSLATDDDEIGIQVNGNVIQLDCHVIARLTTLKRGRWNHQPSFAILIIGAKKIIVVKNRL